MKRRDFLTAATALSLFAGNAFAAKKKSATTTSKTKSATATKRTTTKKGTRRAAVSHKPQGPVTHTAADPVIENPPEGTSASRLPPVKAPELPSEWRTYEISTTIKVPDARSSSNIWLPLPLNQDTLFQRTLGYEWSGNALRSSVRRRPDGEMEVFHSQWEDGNDAHLQLTVQVMAADRHFDITRRSMPPEREDILRHNLQASRLIPNDGLAHQQGVSIVGRIKDPVAQAKAVYDWVIDNSIYDPELAGCGVGDVRKMLLQGRYQGRSAEINGLFVAICRAIGIPARCVYGLRVGPSRLFNCLGLNSDNATSGHHVRAEFYIPGYGWIPVDPSDVRRAIALEGLTDNDNRLQSLKRVLFGVWEMNWIAFNVGTDITLPGRQDTLPFLVSPLIEPEPNGPGAQFYTIRARRIEL